MLGVKLTIDVQLVDFSLDRLRLLRLSRDKLAFDGLDQARADRVEFDGKVRSVHLPGFAVCFVVYVLFSATESGGLAGRDELIQLLRGCRREVNKPWESKFIVWSQGALIRLLWVASSIVKVETFRRRRDNSTAERGTVEEESLGQNLQLGFGSHGLRDALLKGSDHIYMYIYACVLVGSNKLSRPRIRLAGVADSNG